MVVYVPLALASPIQWSWCQVPGMEHEERKSKGENGSTVRENNGGDF